MASLRSVLRETFRRRLVQLRRVFFLGGVVVALAACTSVNTKFGRLNKGQNKTQAKFEPTPDARACTSDAECIEVDVGCSACCPGGAAVNRKFLDVFKRHSKDACAKSPANGSAGGSTGANGKATLPDDCTCVMAPIRCLKGLCTWDYQGPDPSAL